MGEHSGKDGEDWKCRRAGRLKDGVEGMTSRMGLLSWLPGVEMVKLRLDGRRLGGVGGLIKDGEGGSELFFSLFCAAPRVAVGFRRRLPKDVDVLIPRFLRFRGFFAGVVGRCNSKKVLGDDSCEPLSVRRDRKSATNDDDAAFATGDSGEGPGEGSVTEEESIVDMVVVGELSEDPVELLSRLSRCMWNEEKGSAPPLVCGLVNGPCARAPSALGNGLRWELRASSPNTDPKDGIANALGLACILDRRSMKVGPRLGSESLVLVCHCSGLGMRSEEDGGGGGVRLRLSRERKY